jgi:hypothetical protein
MLPSAVGAKRKGPRRKSAPPEKWPLAPIVEDLVRQTERLGLGAAEIGALIGKQQRQDQREKGTDAQSFYDVKDGTKRLWINDAEVWARRLGGVLRVRYEGDHWSELEAAIGALPTQQYRQLKRHLSAVVRDEREAAAAAASRPKERAAGTSR